MHCPPGFRRMGTGPAYIQPNSSKRIGRQRKCILSVRQTKCDLSIRLRGYCSHLDYRHRVCSMVLSLRPKKQSVPRKYSLQSHIARALTEQYLHLFFAAIAILLSAIRGWNLYILQKQREPPAKYTGSTESTGSLIAGRGNRDEVELGNRARV